MQVKEYLQALCDESKIRVEKIGCGNWYWSFLSEEKKTREGVLDGLRDEMKRVRKGIEELRAKVDGAGRERDDTGAGNDGRPEREQLTAAHAVGKDEVESLQEELDGYSECDPGEVIRKRVELEALKGKAGMWTDNILTLEDYLMEVTGGSREAVEGFRRMFYGDEYVEGEGLREL